MKRLTMIACLLMGCAAGLPLSAADWVGTWTAAPEPTELQDMPQTLPLDNNSLRQVVRVSLGGEEMRIQLSNEYSTEPLEIRSVYIAEVGVSGDVIRPKTARYLLFDGKKNVTIAPGKAVFSDLLKYNLKPLQRLSVTIHYGNVPKNMTSHRGSRTTSYIMKGEAKPQTRFAAAERPEHWYSIAAIDVKAEGRQCYAVLGNSITDGRGTTTDAQNRWTDICAEALGGEVGMLNLGIGGNCVVRGGLSTPGISRYDRDILQQRGITGVIIFEGINDIGGSRHAEETVEQLTRAYEDFIRKAHARGLKAIGCTITQIGETDYWSPIHEAVRQTVNEWIRTSGKFDVVLDFESLTADPDKPTCLRQDYRFDNLHPNAAGYQALGTYAAGILKDFK